ncbi:MAG: hypothetical protein RL418_642 [Actinomycetota bacterium]
MHDRYHDSAGVPWEGRQFESNTWSDDDGSAPIALANALAAKPLDKVQLFQALKHSRLLIPLVANLGEQGVGAHGQMVDKSADLAIVAVSTPDNKTAIPAFTSVAEMTQWNSQARPVPVSAAKVALAAVSEGHERVVIDAGSMALAIRRPALAMLAQGLDWLPPHQNPRVRQLVSIAALTQPLITSVDLFDADPAGRLEKAELLIQLGLKPGIMPEQLRQLLEAFNKELQSQEFLSLVDSIALKLVA